MRKNNFISLITIVLFIVTSFVPTVSWAETPNITFHILDNTGYPASDVTVKVYQDFLRTTLADNLLVSGTGDATSDTVNGDVTFKLNEGSYEYIIERIGFNSIYGTLTVASETKTLTFTLSVAAASVLAPQRSTFSASDNMLMGDGQTTTTIDVLVRDNTATGLNNRSVAMVSSRGNLDIFDASSKLTANSGRAQFLLKSSIPGKAKLYATVDGVRIATNAEVTFTGEAKPAPEKSTITLSANETAAGAPVTLSVIIRSLANDPLSNRTVQVASNRTEDVVSPQSVATDANGAAVFQIASQKTGALTLTITSGSTQLGTAGLTITGAAPTLPGLPEGVAVGDLVKSSENPAVYYVGRDAKRHSFPNEKTYFTWYEDFASVKTVSAEVLASLSLGKNVTYRPGVRMIKLQTIPKVYAVSRGSALRWIETEALAIAFYGSDWNKKIDDMSDAFFINYTEGALIDEAADFSPADETAATKTIDDQFGL